MLTPRVQLFLLLTAALLPLLGLAVLVWHRYYRDDSSNTARRVVKNSAVPAIVRLVVRAIDMLFALVLYRLLAPEAVGQYDLAALLVVQYLGTFADFGLGTLLTREVARRPDEAPRYFSTTLLLRWGFTLLALPLALGLIGTYAGLATLVPGARALSADGAAAILILWLTLIPGSYNNVITALFNARERMEIPAAVELVTQIVSVFARVAVLLAGWGVIGLAWAAVGTSTLTALILLILQVRLLFTPRLGLDWSFGRSLLRPAFPLLLNSLLINVAFSFDTFILRAFTDDLTVAQYRMPYRVLNVALILPPLITGAVFPVIARYATENREAFNRTYRLTLQVLMIAAFPIAVGTTLLAPELVYLFVGAEEAPQFLGASDQALMILIWFLPLSYLNGLTQYALIALDRQAALTRSFAIMATFNFVSNLLLIPLYGIYAASVLTILSELVLYLTFLPLLRSERVLPQLAAICWRPASAALLMGGAMLAVHPLGFVPALLTGPPVYALALWLLGAFGAEERALVQRVLGRS